MCGITGFVGLNDKSKIRKMTEIIKHRGPDDYGYFSDRGVELGNRRLAIIDLSKRGHQPMSNENGDVWITYNGEIYNFKELRWQLENKGHKFRSNTDTEVIIHTYEEYGPACLKLFNGIFAFAIWDARKGKKQLFLARDRIGKQPLYYYFDKEKLLFASEIKAILEFGIKREVDVQALSNYLTFTYTPGPLTMFKGIRKLLPGHYLVYKNKKVTLRKYWDFDFKPEQNTERFYEKLLFKTLKDTVRKQLISDVPLGHYLSGGIDSSSILAMMSLIRKETGGKEIKTFSVGFNTNEVLDELKYARLVAEKFSTDHHELIVSEDSIKEFPRILWQLDEPIPNVTLMPLYFMSKETKKHATVILTGNGGDEIFAGYRQHSLIHYANEYYKKFPRLFESNATINLFEAISKLAPTQRIRRYGKFATKFLPAVKNSARAYRTLVYLDFDEAEKSRLLTREIRKKAKKERIIEDLFQKKIDLINKLTLVDLKLTLPDQYLLNDDKLTMAHSIESRVPYLDNKMLAFTEKLPTELKLKDGTSKYIFRKTMASYLPKEIIKRKKYGFTAPLQRWYGSYLSEVATSLLDSPEIVNQGFFNRDYLRNLLVNSKNSVEKINKIILLLTFEIWYKIFIMGDRMNKLI